MTRSGSAALAATPALDAAYLRLRATPRRWLVTGAAGFIGMAVGERTTPNATFPALRDTLAQHGVFYDCAPVYRDFHPGGVRHSQADIAKARERLGYESAFSIDQGIEAAVPWYVVRLRGIDDGAPAGLIS